MRAVRHLLESVMPRYFSGMLPEPPSGFHAMGFEGAHDKLFIVWTETSGKNQMIECPADKLISATDILGKTLPGKPVSKGGMRIRISENSGPIYLLFRSESRP